VPNTHPTEFQGVTATAKANLYYDGGVVSHSLLFADGSKKTLGLIFPGKYHFNTEAPELMQITDGDCRVRLNGSDHWTVYTQGNAFEVPGNSGFDIEVTQGVAQYICSFL